MNRIARRGLLSLSLLFLATGALADDIFTAAQRGDLFTVRHYLAKEPASARSTDAAGYTALHWAAIRGHGELVETLVEAGAEVNAIGGDGGTPLHWACHHDDVGTVRLLLDGGADPAIRNRWGRTPLHVAARRGCTQVAMLLLARGAEPDATTREGWTPLHVAYLSGQGAVVELLTEAGASITMMDAEGKKPADYRRRRPAAIPLDVGRLDEYAGRYALGPDAVIKVWREGESLRLVEFAPDEIYPIGPDRFHCRQEPWTLTFLRDEAGAVDRVRIDYLRRSVVAGRLPVYEYVGSRRCAGCHSSAETGAQYVNWLSSRHALAYWRLATDWAKFLAAAREQYRDIEAPIEEWRCLKCHVTGAQDPDAVFAEGFNQGEGVGCEACHGPGSAYVDPEIMSDRSLFLAAGGRLPGETTCMQCHQGGGFHFDERLPKIAHPIPARK